MTYTATDLREWQLAHVDECQLHLQGPGTLSRRGELFSLHPLAIEDVLNKEQRPKVDSYDGQLFVILGLAVMEESILGVRQISLFVGEHYVISFCDGNRDPFEPVRERLRKKG